MHHRFSNKEMLLDSLPCSFASYENFALIVSSLVLYAAVSCPGAYLEVMKIK